jgi:hypothetical protein
MIINISQLTVEYMNATINRATQKAELGIGTNQFRQRWQTLQIKRYGSRFGHQDAGSWIFGHVSN